MRATRPILCLFLVIIFLGHSIDDGTVSLKEEMVLPIFSTVSQLGHNDEILNSITSIADGREQVYALNTKNSLISHTTVSLPIWDIARL